MDIISMLDTYPTYSISAYPTHIQVITMRSRFFDAQDLNHISDAHLRAICYVEHLHENRGLTRSIRSRIHAKARRVLND